MRFIEFTPESRDAWAAAAEYTRDRREQIRQLRREISVIEGYVDAMSDDITEAADAPDTVDAYRDFRRDVLTMARTTARLESALADLERDMLPEAL